MRVHKSYFLNQINAAREEGRGAEISTLFSDETEITQTAPNTNSLFSKYRLLNYFSFITEQTLYNCQSKQIKQYNIKRALMHTVAAHLQATLEPTSTPAPAFNACLPPAFHPYTLRRTLHLFDLQSLEM